MTVADVSLQVIRTLSSFKFTIWPFAMKLFMKTSMSDFVAAEIAWKAKAAIAIITTVWTQVSFTMTTTTDSVSLYEGLLH